MQPKADQPLPFSLGLTYWPRRSAFDLWRRFDRVATSDELAHIADLGCDTVRLCLTWEDFQPSPQRIGGAAMRALEQALDATEAAGLRAVLALFPVALGGALQIPAWANGVAMIEELASAGALGPTLAVPAPDVPVLYGGTYHANQARDLFSYRPHLAAQRYLIGEIVGYFGAHPAVWAWQIGEGLERVHRPASAEAVRRWHAATADAVRERRAGARVLGVTSARGLRLRAGPRPEHIVESCDLLGVAADPPEAPGEARRHTDFAAFVHALAAGLAERGAILTSVGLPTAPDERAAWVSDEAYGRPLRAYLGSAEEQARFVEAALDRLYRGGAAGVWLAAYADHPQEHWRAPPLDRSARSRTLGLVDASGGEKPAADALRSFARRLRDAGGAARADAPRYAVDPERYWHDPSREFAALWREFIAAE